MTTLNRRFFELIFISLTFLALAIASADAQSNVWNTPSTDIQPERTSYVEINFLTHFGSYEKGGFQSYGVRGIYGVRRNVEIGINALYTKAGDEPQPVEVQPNFKWRFYQNEKRGINATIGGMYFAPVNHRRGTDAHGIVYATASKKFNHFYGPRFTTGFYGLIGRQKGQGARKGFTVAYEQPLHRKVSFVADWFSGNNRLGYVGGGLAFSVSQKSIFSIGYNVGNNGRRNNYLGASYAYIF